MRTCCVSLKLSYFSLLASEQLILASKTSPFCTTAVEIELYKSFLPNFAGIVKFVAKMLMGMIWEWFLCIFGVVHDWNCLIGSLVIQHGHLTCNFVAYTSYVVYIYMYISLACSYVVFIYPYISHVRCAFRLLSATYSHMGDTSTCSMVCCRYNNPTSAPIGDPNMVRLSWGL